ncbi:MAG: four-carbon acid sugar kinase family protein [Rhodospirillales bacterium]|nr:four-carbon acid sugar kinase family protein [Rhodospirillales bacterium]MBO6788749.1 four-carbon acid sugar kinase family protein [Rhodospirillales bacterium]
MLLGCIADDSTGATDLANTLVKGGMNTIQIIGVPAPDMDIGETDAVVVALKSRTNPAAEAIEDSLAALAWLRAQGAQQILFKYCSTFDSTDAGNIGPVADALLDAMGADFTIACPAFPETGRSIYKGYLFVGDVLLSESGMENHPLNPMTDPNLVRVLDRQTPNAVGLVELATVRKGADAIHAAFDGLKAKGIRHAIVDAVFDEDLIEIGHASKNLELITGGSGIAMGLPDNFRALGALTRRSAPALPQIVGRSAVIAGSCSKMTRKQIAHTRRSWPSFNIDPWNIAAGKPVVAEVLDWAAAQDDRAPVLIFSSADPDEVAAIQAEFGREEAGEMVEKVMGQVARGLLDMGVNRLVVAGGETSGAVVKALDIRALRIGPEIDPGVPWTEAIGGVPLALALKSGNFGAEDFFEKSLGMLP